MGSIDLYVNSEFMCFKQDGDMSSEIGDDGDDPLKLVHSFTYLVNNIPSTESVI